MMRLKNIIVLVWLICMGCSNDDGNQTEYHPFSEEDRNNLLIRVPEKDAIISYENQNGEVFSFRVQNSESGLVGAYGGGGGFAGGGTTLLYNYDTQLIEMEFLNEPDPFPIFTLCISKNRDDSLKATLYFELWNKTTDETFPSVETLDLDFSAPRTTLTIDEKTYNDVIIYTSEINEVNGSWFGIDRNVHTIYYDVLYGCIGYDDLNGNMWRIKM
ncbi:hypothetical protein [uncultured Dokdonia sp.]|uniref:hypothetical protein n=1 Tax=uncultured Dokdonia sp. TaxID=575653 RepID=UPI0026113786|nr:hypothetical protein [uncultured Dokdonia sp.]